MTEKYEGTILLTDPTGTVGNSVLKRLASSGQNTIRVAIDMKNKVEKLKYAHEVLNIDYTRPEAIADALNNVDRLFLRIPPSSDMVNISYNFVEEAKNSAEIYTSFIQETAASLHALLMNETQERRKEILKAVIGAARKYTDNNTGKVRFENEAILIVGKK